MMLWIKRLRGTCERTEKSNDLLRRLQTDHAAIPVAPPNHRGGSVGAVVGEGAFGVAVPIIIESACGLMDEGDLAVYRDAEAGAVYAVAKVDVVHVESIKGLFIEAHRVEHFASHRK